MTTDTACAFVECPGWEWVPGMLYRYGPYDYRHAEESGTPGADCYPVESDPATIGCILDLVRKAWGDPTLHVVAYHTTIGDDLHGEQVLWWAMARARDPVNDYEPGTTSASRLIAIRTATDYLCARPTVAETLLLALQNAPATPTEGE